MTTKLQWRRLTRQARTFVAAFIVLGLASCGGSGGGGSLPTADGTAELPNTTYALGPNDRVRVVVFRHDDMSGEFELDGDGNFAMPLIGEVQAAGLSQRALEDQIETQLADGYLVEPQVSVEVLNYRPFYILGEVNRPGVYEYLNGITVINAIALAGGYTYRANENSVRIKRGGSNSDGVIVSDTTTVLPGDVIEVPERFF